MPRLLRPHQITGMNAYLSLLLGVVLAGGGGELFLRGVVGIAARMRVAPAIIAATVAAFATSSPELAIAINSGLAGKPEISLGDALGSNVVNIALILGLVLLMARVQATRASVKRDFPTALLAPVLLAVLTVDGTLSRIDALLLLASFFLWLLTVVIEARQQRSATAHSVEEQRAGAALLSAAAGLALLFAAGDFIVTGAKAIALAFGMDEFVIGATVVAIGTSVPELATALIAKLRGNDEVGLGTLLGSNIFNALLIAGVAAAIYPIPIVWREVALSLGFGVVTTALVFPSRAGNIARMRGALLLALYAAYLVTLLQR